MPDARVLTISIVECPAGGFVIKDGSLNDPDITAKSTLREAQNACADMIGQYFLPPPPEEIDEAEEFEPPRMMREAQPTKRRGLLRAIIGGRTA